ncbi:MAG: hydroxyacid dehydrogenase [Magnetovibrio sp.]|nr:hydroxyacid dehydrogenase [Magnetovibrio sp.]
MADIVISEFMDQAAVDALGDFDLLYDAGLVDRPDDLAAAVAGARALIVRNRTQVRGDLLAAADALEVVGRLGVGLDNIDVAVCAARGVEVCPATGANADAVAEYVVTTALMLLRGAYQAKHAMIKGEWPRDRLQGREAGGRRLGLIGFGTISRITAAKALALGMEVVAHDPMIDAADPVWAESGAAPADLDELLATSDAVSLHVPLVDATRHLIDGPAIERMKDDAVLINTARGGVVDDAALALALKDGRLGGAALDVFEAEPLPADNFFKGVPNLILTPHIAGVSYDSNIRVSAVTADNVRRVLEGNRA